MSNSQTTDEPDGVGIQWWNNILLWVVLAYIAPTRLTAFLFSGMAVVVFGYCHWRHIHWEGSRLLAKLGLRSRGQERT